MSIGITVQFLAAPRVPWEEMVSSEERRQGIIQVLGFEGKQGHQQRIKTTKLQLSEVKKPSQTF